MSSSKSKYERTRISGLYRYTAKDGTATYHGHYRKDGANKWICHGSDFALAQKRHYEIMGRGPVASSQMTLSEAHEQWRSSTVPLTRCAADQKNLKGRWRLHAEPVLGPRLLAKLSVGDIRRVAAALKAGKLSPESQAHVLGDLRCFLKWCVSEGHLDRSPWPEGIMPKIDPQPPDRLSDDEVEAVLQVEEPYRFICRFFLGTGLRWSEGCRSQRAHVEGKVLAVYQTKNGKMRRVPLRNPVSGDALLPDVLGRVGRLVPFSELSYGSFNKAVKRRTRVDGFHVHRLRHTFACRYLENGGSLVALQQILGHSSIEITQRYAKLSDEHVLRECERLMVAR